MKPVTISLDRLELAADAPPAEDTPAPQIEPLPFGPLLVWELDEDCYVAFGAAGFLRAWRARAEASCAEVGLECLVLHGDTLEEARAQIRLVPDALFAQALCLMDGTLREIGEQVGYGKTQVGELISTWRDASPPLRERWLAGLSSKTAFEFSRFSTAAQLEAVRGARTMTPESGTKLKPPIGARQGAPRGARGRPSVNQLRKFMGKLVEVGARNDYEAGVLDTLRYALNGTISTDSRWEVYAGRHGAPRRPERDREDRGHSSLDP